VPDGPTIKLMQKVAAKHRMAIVVPIYEQEMTGLYYNTAAVIDADGKYLGKYRKHHIPQVAPGFWESLLHTRRWRIPNVPDEVRAHRRVYLL